MLALAYYVLDLLVTLSLQKVAVPFYHLVTCQQTKKKHFHFSPFGKPFTFTWPQLPFDVSYAPLFDLLDDGSSVAVLQQLPADELEPEEGVAARTTDLSGAPPQDEVPYQAAVVRRKLPRERVLRAPQKQIVTSAARSGSERRVRDRKR